jgi:hypothetical protein
VDDEECKDVVKMNNMHCVLEECISNEVVPEIHFVALLKLKALARTVGGTHLC